MVLDELQHELGAHGDDDYYLGRYVGGKWGETYGERLMKCERLLISLSRIMPDITKNPSWIIILNSLEAAQSKKVKTSFEGLMDRAIGDGPWRGLDFRWKVTKIEDFVRESQELTSQLRTSAVRSSEVPDFDVVDMAAKYGGVLTLMLVAREGRTTLDIAEEALQRFINHKQARVINCGEMEVYFFPSAQVRLLDADRKIIDLILANGGRATRVELLRGATLSLEALDAGLKRLEREGIVGHTADGTFYLTGVGARE